MRRIVCEYIDSNESVVSLRYSPKDGTILPITVCAEDDLQEAKRTVAVRHVIFGAAYCIECLAVVFRLFQKKSQIKFYDNSTAFYEEYFGPNCEKLVDAIKAYRQHNGSHKKDEHYLAELLK